MKFEYDILISFSSLDNQQTFSGEDGWVSEFKKSLEMRLSQLLGMKPKIIMTNSKEDEVVENQNDENIDYSKVAIFIPIVSKFYLKSESNLIQLDEACKIRNENKPITEGSLPFVFKLLKNPSNKNIHPLAIQQNIEYHFFDKNIEDNTIKELSPSLLNQTEKLYWSKIDDIAIDIFEYFKAIGHYTESKKEIKKQNGINIYLAECSSDTVSYRDVFKRELSDNGHQVFPKKPLSTQMPAVYSEIVQNLSQTLLSIHILGSDYGVVPEGSNRSLVELQNDVADELLSKKGGNRIIWIPENVIPSDERQKILIEDIRISMKGIGSAEVVVGDLEVCKSLIEDTIVRIENNKLNSINDGLTNLGNSTIYLIYDFYDKAQIPNLVNYLKLLNCDVVTSADGIDETEIRNKHVANLKNCDAVMIYYGNGSELWLKTRLLDLLRIPAYGRKKSGPHKSIVCASPRSDDKYNFNSVDAEIFYCFDEIDTEGIKSWINSWIK